MNLTRPWEYFQARETWFHFDVGYGWRFGLLWLDNKPLFALRPRDSRMFYLGFYQPTFKPCPRQMVLHRVCGVFHMKHCSRCKQNPPLNRQRHCRECRNAYQREWRKVQTKLRRDLKAIILETIPQLYGR